MFDKKLYWERRNKKLRGQTEEPTVYRKVEDEEGNVQTVPVGSKTHAGFGGMSARQIKRKNDRITRLRAAPRTQGRSS